MNFFPGKYFLKKFFPAAWFGGGTEAVAPRFGDMAATMAGSGAMSGELSASVREDHPPIINVVITGATLPRPERWKVFGDMTATMTGVGKMAASLRATGDIDCIITGKGTMLARPVIDITGLLRQRRAEKEAVMALLLAVG